MQDDDAVVTYDLLQSEFGLRIDNPVHGFEERFGEEAQTERMLADFDEEEDEDEENEEDF